MQHKSIFFLVEDDPDDLEIFHLALRDTGREISCISAEDGIKALEKLNGDTSFIPHYIFIDINMPRMNGCECLAAIKKIKRLKNVPVFMYSTSSDPNIISRTKHLGATEFIVKPASIKELVLILTEVMGPQKTVRRSR
jgi:CheY-like chemotaxis protein